MPAAIIAETAAEADSRSSKATTADAHVFRKRHQLQPRRGDDSQRSFAADERRGEIVTGVVEARRKDFARCVDDFQADDVIHGRAVGETVRSAGVGGDVAADRRDQLRGGIGRVEESARRGITRQLSIDQAGLHARAPVLRVELENAVHAREREDDSALHRHGAAAEPGSRAARDDRFAAIAGDLDDGADVARAIAARRPRLGRPPSVYASNE